MRCDGSSLILSGRGWRQGCEDRPGQCGGGGADMERDGRLIKRLGVLVVSMHFHLDLELEELGAPRTAQMPCPNATLGSEPLEGLSAVTAPRARAGMLPRTLGTVCANEVVWPTGWTGEWFRDRGQRDSGRTPGKGGGGGGTYTEQAKPMVWCGVVARPQRCIGARACDVTLLGSVSTTLGLGEFVWCCGSECAFFENPHG